MRHSMLCGRSGERNITTFEDASRKDQSHSAVLPSLQTNDQGIRQVLDYLKGELAFSSLLCSPS